MLVNHANSQNMYLCNLNFVFMKKLHLLAITFWFVAVAALAQPPVGYYNGTAGLTGADLKTALHDIIKGHTEVTYNSIWTHFQTTDVKPNGKVWCMYSDLPGNPPYEYTFSDDQCTEATAPYEDYCYNREHSFPRSWYGAGGNEEMPMHTDLHHVYPTDAWVNELRSYFPFGVVTNPTTTTLNGGKLGPNTAPGYTGTVFEPIDEYKGDFARTMLYMVTRYHDIVAGWPASSTYGSLILDGTAYPALKTWYLDLMLQWHAQDPVSQKEIDRNNAVYAIQGNRNPFIDHPEFANCIWATCLEDEPLHHVTQFSANTITLSWDDATGTVLPTGYLVRMSDQGFESIATPTNGTAIADDHWNKNVPYGTQTVTFGQLTPGTTYYFKIFGYTGSGASITYKTDGTVPQTSIVAN